MRILHDINHNDGQVQPGEGSSIWVSTVNYSDSDNKAISQFDTGYRKSVRRYPTILWRRSC